MVVRSLRYAKTHYYEYTNTGMILLRLILQTSIGHRYTLHTLCYVTSFTYGD